MCWVGDDLKGHAFEVVPMTSRSRMLRWMLARSRTARKGRGRGCSGLRRGLRRGGGSVSQPSLDSKTRTRVRDIRTMTVAKKGEDVEAGSAGHADAGDDERRWRRW